MYSLMNVGKNYFCHLHAEQVIAEAMEQGEDQNHLGLMEVTINPSVINDILREQLRNIRIFLEISGVLSLDTVVLDALVDATKMMLSDENEIYFLGCNEEIKEILKESFQKAEFPIWEQYSWGGFWYLEIKMFSKDAEAFSAKRCSDVIYEIHEDNLKILVEDGPKGKAMDVKRLFEDGEDCIYYYCYRLAQRMVEEELVFKDQTKNQDICLIAGNDAGYNIARELSRILGTTVCTEDTLKDKENDIKKYIIVRDVIHMFCELNRLSTLIEGAGSSVYGSACLIDINTGVGSRKNRASVYTIDLEKGISYRLRNKKIDR